MKCARCLKDLDEQNFIKSSDKCFDCRNEIKKNLDEDKVYSPVFKKFFGRYENLFANGIISANQLEYQRKYWLTNA